MPILIPTLISTLVPPINLNRNSSDSSQPPDCVPFFPERHKRNESPGHDRGPLPRVREHDEGRDGGVQGPRHLQPLLRPRALQFHQERARRDPEEAGAQQRSHHGQLLPAVSHLQGSFHDRRRRG